MAFLQIGLMSYINIIIIKFEQDIDLKSNEVLTSSM